MLRLETGPTLPPHLEADFGPHRPPATHVPINRLQRTATPRAVAAEQLRPLGEQSSRHRTKERAKFTSTQFTGRGVCDFKATTVPARFGVQRKWARPDRLSGGSPSHKYGSDVMRVVHCAAWWPNGLLPRRRLRGDREVTYWSAKVQWVFTHGQVVIHLTRIAAELKKRSMKCLFTMCRSPRVSLTLQT